MEIRTLKMAIVNNDGKLFKNLKSKLAEAKKFEPLLSEIPLAIF